MKTFLSVWVIILVAALVVAAEKNGWQWQEDDKLLADFGQDCEVNELVVCQDGSVIVAVYQYDEPNRGFLSRAGGGKLVAITSDGLKIFAVPSGSARTVFLGLTISPDGKHLYAVDSSLQQVFAWTLFDQKLVPDMSLQADVQTLRALNFRDGTSVGGSVLMAEDNAKQDALRRGTVRIRSGVQGIDQEFELGGEIRNFGFAPTASPKDSYLAVLAWEHKQASGGNYGPYWVFFIGPRAPGLPWESLARHKVPGAPYQVTISPVDSTKVVIGTSKGIVVMNRNTGKFAQLGSPLRTDSVMFLPDGTLVSSSEDGKIRVWEMGKTRPVATFGKSAWGISVLATGGSESSDFVAGVGGSVRRFQRQRSEGKPVATTGGK